MENAKIVSDPKYVAKELAKELSDTELRKFIDALDNELCLKNLRSCCGTSFCVKNEDLRRVERLAISGELKD
jgi:hypothetical protein